MAVQRRVNLLSQQRVDVPDVRSIESAVSNDFDQLTQAFITNTSQGYIMRGFNILMAGAIGNAASSLQMQVDPGAVLHIAASQSGTVLMVPAGTAPQQLNAATNTNVTGAFTPSSINYVTLDYIRFIDPSTSAQVYIWDPSSNTETTKIAPRAQILEFVINISTSTPTPNQLFIATVLTDAANLVVDISDARYMLCSLETGGLTPNPSYSYPWTQGRNQAPVTSSSDSVDPFNGADKNIGSLKEWMNAVMTTFKEIKGTPYWFTGSATSTFPAVYQNAALNVLNGGTWVYPSLGHLELKGGSEITRFGFVNSLILSPFGPQIGSPESLTATVTDTQIVDFTTPASATINIGDTVTIGAVTLDINTVNSQSSVIVDEPGFTNGSGQAATLRHYASFDLTANQVLYILIPTADSAVTYGYGDDGANPVLPKQVTGVTASTITVALGGNYPTSGSGNILAHGQTFSYTSYSAITGVFAGVSPDPLTTVSAGDYVYQLDSGGVGYYTYSTPATVPGVDGAGVSLGAERVMWLAYYDGSSTMFLRNAQLSVGESIQVGDTLSTSILSYIGMPNQATNSPTYSSDIRGIAKENLTNRIGVLTDAVGDEQEDRSAYLRSTDPVTWDGSTLTFTADIVLEIVNTKSGVITTHTLPAANIYSPAVVAGQIDLTFDGYTAWILIDRLATSETPTVNITPLNAIPAQTQANKDVFVLFKAVGTSGSADLYLPFIKQLINPGQTVRIGASGTGSGGEGGDFGLDSLSYNASFVDSFDTLPTLNSTAVDMSAGHTNAAYSIIGQFFTISYDATKTLTGTGTSMAFSAAPSYTVKTGDVVLFGGRARRITALGTINSDGGSGTPFTIEAAFATNPTAAASTVSQAVYTVDINNYTNNSTEESLATALPSALTDMLLDYDDAASGNQPDLTVTPNVSFTASSTGTASDYTPIVTRALLTSIESITSFPSSGSELLIRFFANPALSGSGTVNLLNYEAFIHNDTSLSGTGYALDQAYCFTDSSETPINCNQPTVVGGKTRIGGLPLYAKDVNLGKTNGQLYVSVGGQKIPRFVAGSTNVAEGYYREIDSNTIELDSDYSGYGYDVEVIRWTGVIDSNVQNSSRISVLHDVVVGSPADVLSGVANYSSLQSAISSVANNANILVLKSYSTSEAISISNPVTIEGQGRGTQIAGTVSISSQFSTVKNLRFNANITIPGTYNFVRECFSAPGVTIDEPTPGSNSLLIIGE